MWPAAEYGRTMYAVRQRAGILVIQMEKRFGELRFKWRSENRAD